MAHWEFTRRGVICMTSLGLHNLKYSKGQLDGPGSDRGYTGGMASMTTILLV